MTRTKTTTPKIPAKPKVPNKQHRPKIVVLELPPDIAHVIARAGDVSGIDPSVIATSLIAVTLVQAEAWAQSQKGAP